MKLKLKIDSKKFVRSVKRLMHNISDSCAEHGTLFAEKVLSTSNQMCPFETGTLRNSGRVFIKWPGQRFHWISEVRGATVRGGGSVQRRMVGNPGVGYVPYYRWQIGYKRTAPWPGSGQPFDVAFFTHENFEYKPQHPGTGPKYLERAVFRHQNQFRQFLRRGLREAITRSRGVNF